ncbi:hypothetical protein GUJ93_ZPchr0003g18235 [Zizania palustris]|uniref:Uncharacterized protein n=1 Tax=Zizania palustris TaxID=103762 RepID=A0A8J5S0Q6_ZIZPA|nr:hypothetical protein GUJ93_ZPchr0003g18235 [Zizania palustris]
MRRRLSVLIPVSSCKPLALVSRWVADGWAQTAVLSGKVSARPSVERARAWFRLYGSGGASLIGWRLKCSGSALGRNNQRSGSARHQKTVW